MGTQLPLPQMGTEPPVFGPYLLWPNGWMDQDATWYGIRPQLRIYTSAQLESGTAAPLFLAHVYCGHGRQTELLLSSGFYRARNARIASAVLATAIPSVCLSVRLSVRHTPVLCQNGGM